jgi:hypothetical protein
MATALENENIPSVEKILRTIRRELKIRPRGKRAAGPRARFHR